VKSFIDTSETVFFTLSNEGTIIYKSPNFDAVFNHSLNATDIINQAAENDRDVLKKLFDSEDTKTISLVNNKVSLKAKVSIIKTNQKLIFI
jgi:hypothetical protein